VSIAARFSKGGFHALFRLGPTASGLDAVVFGTRHHLVICLTAVVEGRREIVGVEVQPATPGFKLSEWMQSPRPIAERAERALETYDDLLVGEPQPVSAALLRGIPLTTVLGFREATVTDQLKLAHVYEAQGVGDLISKVDISTADESRLAYLDDAVMYVNAVRERAKPAEVIAEARSISKRTAEGRIAKARALGLLSKASGKTASGELTADAVRLDEWRRSLTEGTESTDG
jgi:hypothetical protein